jgi:hypothetical protein
MHPVTLHDDIQNKPTAQITPRPPALSCELAAGQEDELLMEVFKAVKCLHIQ